MKPNNTLTEIGNIAFAFTFVVLAAALGYRYIGLPPLIIVGGSALCPDSHRAVLPNSFGGLSRMVHFHRAWCGGVYAFHFSAVETGHLPGNSAESGVVWLTFQLGGWRVASWQAFGGEPNAWFDRD